MAAIKRNGQAVWMGDLRSGSGQLGTDSGALKEEPYSFGTRFEDKTGTNPEELIAAAHAACYSMAFANTLSGEGYKPNRVETKATCTLSPLDEGGFAITKMHLQVSGEVEDLDQETFEALAQKAHKGCPVSNALVGNLDVEIEATLK